MDVESNGMLGHLPLELVVRILNGHGCDSTKSGEGKRRPLLDPRWRFAARAVCRLWRDIVEQPAPEDAAAMGKHPHRRWNEIHEYTPTGCPKWPTGRVVCMTVVADWIAADPARWTDDNVDHPEALYLWCVREAQATRKHVVAALVASGQPWAMEQAFDHHWPLLTYIQSRPPASPPPTADRNDPHIDYIDRGEHNDGFRADGPSCARMAGEYDGWDRDDDGDVEGLVDVLLSVSLSRNHGDVHKALCDRFAYPESQASLTDVIQPGHSLLLERLIRAGAEVNDFDWDAAATAESTVCLAVLLDLCAEDPPLVHAPSPVANAPSTEPRWIERAIAAG